MGNYYVLTGQGQTKSWGYYTVPDWETGNIPISDYYSGYGIKVDYLKSARDNKYTESRDYFVVDGLVPAFLSLGMLRGFCRLNNYKTIKPQLLKQRNPNLILQLVKAGALFQSAEVVFTKPIPQNIIDNLKKNKINWSLQQSGGGAFNTLKVFV